MTLIEEALRDKVFIDFGTDPVFGSDQAYRNVPSRFATVTFQLVPTDLLVKAIDRMREEKGYQIDEDTWYDFHVGLNDFDPLKVDTCIEAVVCDSSSMDEGDPYYIDLGPQEQEAMMSHLDRQCRKYLGKGCLDLLAEARKRLEGNVT